MLYKLDTKHKIRTYSSLKSSFIKRVKKNLILGFSNKSGRNFYGRITIFTKGGGMKKKLRVLDFKRILYSQGIVISKERD
jgi:ribosomal protein L2